MSVKEALERLRDAIKRIDVYQNAWERMDYGLTFEDPFRSYTVGNDYIREVFYVPKLKAVGKKMGLPAVINGYVNCRIAHDGTEIDDVYIENAEIYRPFAITPIALILPNHFNYVPYTIRNPNGKYVSGAIMSGGLYLSKTSGGNYSNWIERNYLSASRTPVKCPVDANVPYYLNQLNISADDMVGIFENMIDRSSESGVKYITLGYTNLAKLTQAQKNIAINKGWSLQ